MKRYRLQISGSLFWGFNCEYVCADDAPVPTHLQLVNAALGKLRFVLVQHNMCCLLDELKKLNFHIHTHIQEDDIKKACEKSDIIYICVCNFAENKTLVDIN